MKEKLTQLLQEGRDRIAAVRTAVNGALEQARADKTIGKSLEADVALTVPAEDAFLGQMEEGALADLLIVSQVRVETGDSLSVTVRPASGTKCQRCWKVLTSVGTVAGCYVQDGKLQRKDCQVRLVRDGIVIHEGVLASLQRFKDSVKEVKERFECGLTVEKFNDIKEGDIVEAFTMEEIPQ